MGRRRKSSTADDIVEIVAGLPWWVGLMLAAIVWVLFEAFTPAAPAATSLKPGQAASFAANSLIAGIAPYLKYLFTFLCVLGAVVSFIGRRKRAGLMAQAQGQQSAGAVQQMSWREFEMLIGEWFRQRGYAVTEAGGNGPDGGVDLVLRKGNEKFLVQCKQWRAFKVGVSVVREHYGVMAAQGAAGGFVVTSGRFTQEAMEFAAGRNVELIDGTRLQQMLQQARVAPATPAAAPPAHAVARHTCPQCQADMVLRTARQGANVGKQFWGCSRYPQCRGTRPAD